MAPHVYQQSYVPTAHYVHHPPPPPPPVAHKVWILDCKSCGTFLTNRGMKAVLLLRPNVALYSSDAQPANCSPWAPEDEGPRDHTGRRRTPSPPRTCDCLTQTLCCHGCGNAVGYMIVIPCHRCTSSIANSNRSTNGHRFVFHSNEISGIERRYVPGERGVKPVDPPPVAHPYWNGRHSEYDSPLSDLPSTSTWNQNFSARSQQAYSSYNPLQPQSLGRPHPDQIDAQDSQEPKDPPYPRRLQAGDFVYWHNLIRGGEVLAVQNDERARRPPTPMLQAISFDR